LLSTGGSTTACNLPQQLQRLSCEKHYNTDKFRNHKHAKQIMKVTIHRCCKKLLHAHTHTQPFNCPMPGTTRMSQYQKGKTNLDFTEARDSQWQWHQLGHIQVCISLQTDNHASTSPLSFLQARCPSCRPTNSIKALKAKGRRTIT